MIKKTLTELERKSIEEYKNIEKLPIIVVLDNIRSMHNVGSVFRISDSFLIEKIYLCGITAQPPHRDIYKSALGSELTVQWEYFSDTIASIEILKNKNFQIIGVEQVHNSINMKKFHFDISQKYAFIFGNEVSGVSEEVLKLCDDFIEISQSGTKHSLNISTCAAIVLWEAYEKFI